MSHLTFLGAAGSVTGSKHVLDTGSHRVLVDCGLFQGLKQLRERNWHPLPVRPETIDAVVLTHAHLDHCGYLPRLVAQGFAGPVYCTGGTRDLCSLVLPDSAHLQEEDAREANRGGYSRHRPALPLYTSDDADRALTRLRTLEYGRVEEILPGIELEFVNAGHLLGSAYARIRFGGTTVLFGGDLGRYGRPVLPDPAPPGAADIALVEATYGNRAHLPDDGGERLAAIVNETAQRGGRIIVPAFAIGRVEEVLYWLKQLEDANRIPSLPVYVDSPMAARALQFYEARVGELDPDMRPAAGGVAVFGTRRLTTVASPQQSKDLVDSSEPAIVVAASGMATGGRVLHHLAATLPDQKHTVLFVGFQAQGTRGRQLVEGARRVRIKGRDIPVAARVEQIDSMSAHADGSEIMRWLSGFPRPPRMLYLVHGEPEALEALRARITQALHWNVEVARYQERVSL